MSHAESHGIASATSRSRRALRTRDTVVAHPDCTAIRNGSRLTPASMVAELDLELAAMRAAAPSLTYQIVSAALIRAGTPYHEYLFEVKDALPPMRAEAPVLVECPGRRPLPAQVVAARGHTIRVATTSALRDPSAPDSRLVIDDAWLLQRMRDRLAGIAAQLDRGEHPRDFNLALAQLAVGADALDRTGAALDRIIVPEGLLADLNEEP